MIACGHPINSYLFLPYTELYAHLGMNRPSVRGLFLAWRRALQNWGSLRDGAEGKSDGVQFRVEINGEPVFDEVRAKSEWKDVRVPLERWVGKQVSVAFVTTPGVKGDTSHDWACWGEPRISYEMSSQPVDIVFASPRPVRQAASSDPHMTTADAGVKDGLHFGRRGWPCPVESPSSGPDRGQSSCRSIWPTRPSISPPQSRGARSRCRCSTCGPGQAAAVPRAPIVPASMCIRPTSVALRSIAF